MNLLKILFAIILFISCSKDNNLSNIPQIEFKKGNLSKEVDNLGNTNYVYTVDISFKDGDGNIGLNKSDTTGNFHKDKKFYYNIFVNYYEKKNNKYEKKDIFPSYNGRIPVLKPIKPIKSIKGTLEYKITMLTYSSDTVMFDFQIADRDLNLSNIVKTKAIIIK